MMSASSRLKAFLATNLGQHLKGLGIRTVGRLGYELVPIEFHSGIHLPEYLSSRGVRTVIDVGANQGQFGTRLRMLGWQGPILSIEPLPSAFRLLEAVARQSPPWEVVRVAAGNSLGVATMNVSRNSVSSSLLSPAKMHIEVAPLSTTAETVDVRVERLDAVVGRSQFCGPFFIKIDTQGYESEVLKGAPTVMNWAELVQLEVSLSPLYEGQADWLEVLESVCGAGYRTIGIEPALIHPVTKETLQVDVLLARVPK